MSAERSVPSRREVIAIGIGTFIVSVVPLTSRRAPRVVRRTMPVMGTLAEIAVVHQRVDVAERAIAAAFDSLTGVERMMSRFRADSDIGRANTSAARHPVPVAPSTAAVVAHALRWARSTHGAFDPAIGRVVELWDVAHRTAPPLARDCDPLAARWLHRAVEVGTEDGMPVIAYRTGDVHLDLGGIAKGYGVDLAADALRRHGVTRALVNVGGDLVALGTAPDGDAWQVGVRAPDDARAILTTIPASDCAIATSGDYEQFFRHRGRRYHHLMDPRTAAPSAGPLHSATVRAARCIDADAAATAAFNLTPGQARDAFPAHDASLIWIA